MRTQVARGRDGAKLKVDILSCLVSVREKRAFKGHAIIIFLCLRLKNKEASKK